MISSGIAVDAITSVTVLASQGVTDQNRIKVIAHNDGMNDVWIKFQAASVDNDMKGILIPSNTFMEKVIVLMEGPNIYTGEISAITAAGTSTIFITSY